MIWRNAILPGKHKDPAFVTVWNTENTSTGSSADNQITMPLWTGTAFDCIVYWGDGTSTVWDGTGSDIGGDATHTYDPAGVYTIRIEGDFPEIYFNNSGDKLKILEVRNWGDIKWNTFWGAFFGCANLEITALDVPQVDGKLGSFNSAFRGIKSVNPRVKLYGIPGMTHENSLYRTFYGVVDGVNYNLNQWNTEEVESFSECLRDLGVNSNLRCDGWNFESATNFADFLFGTTLSTENYDKLLISLNSQDINSGLTFHGGNSKYSGDPAGDPATSGAAARANLLKDIGEGGKGMASITDGGHVDD